MTLLQIFLTEDAYRPWAFAIMACLIACLPRASRRVGGILFFVVVGVFAISLFITTIYAECTPQG